MDNYVPTNWKNGDLITADKLNNIENGISNNLGKLGDIYIYTSTDDGETFARTTMTSDEIIEAENMGYSVFLVVTDNTSGAVEVASSEGGGTFSTILFLTGTVETYYVVDANGSVTIKYETPN